MRGFGSLARLTLALPRPTGRVTPLTVPPAELAVITHLGSHHDADCAYGSLGAYVAEHALGVEAPCASSTSSAATRPPTGRCGKPRSAGRSSTPAQTLQQEIEKISEPVRAAPVLL
jgi:hypothetical protein